MEITLHEFLVSLDPDRTVFEVDRRSQEALMGIGWPEAPIADLDEFKQFMTAVFRHAEKTMLRLSEEASGGDEFDWGRCATVLNKVFGSNGWRTAYDLTVSGAEGGLYGVVPRVINHMASAYTSNEIDSRIAAFWNSLSTEEKLAAPDEYLARYGHLLPADMTEGSAAVVRARFPQVLKLHAQMLKELTRVGRG